MRLFKRWYGAGPLHLLALLSSFALAGFAAIRLVPDNPRLVLIWFVGAVVGHDLLLFPLYALADRSLTGVLHHRRDERPWRLAINHVRVPVLLSLLLLLMWFPLIFGLASSYEGATGHTTDIFLGRWLAITAALFLGSAVVYALRLRLRRTLTG